MSRSTIEGMVRQSTNNPIMDSQLSNYIVLKNGKRISPAMTLEQCVQSVQWREKKLNRLTQHSPYTITKFIH
jgi:hypothetical protein